MRRDVFQAIADPTRREIIDLLARGPQNLVAVTSRFDITRNAVSKHLKILMECGIVKMKREGRNHHFHANLKNLRTVVDWAERYRKFWNDHLDKLEAYLEEEDDD